MGRCDRSRNQSSDCNRSMNTRWMQSQNLSGFLQCHLAMKTSIFLLLVFVLLFWYRVEVATLVLRLSRSIDQSIGCYKRSIRVDYKSDLELFSPVTSSDEDITIFRGYYCKYQLAERPVRRSIICETSSKRTSQTSKQKHNCAKHFGWHWLFNCNLRFYSMYILWFNFILGSIFIFILFLFFCVYGNVW